MVGLKVAETQKGGQACRAQTMGRQKTGAPGGAPMNMPLAQRQGTHESMVHSFLRAALHALGLLFCLWLKQRPESGGNTMGPSQKS